MASRSHFIGRKKCSGKTTLVTELVEQLSQRGYRVATVKHTHHHHELGTPGKDSHRHREAGAVAVGNAMPSVRLDTDEPISPHVLAKAKNTIYTTCLQCYVARPLKANFGKGRWRSSQAAPTKLSTFGPPTSRKHRGNAKRVSSRIPIESTRETYGINNAESWRSSKHDNRSG